ncbi:MAG: helix-turn-helix domain-containing protein [Pseudomonadota bacterium]
MITTDRKPTTNDRKPAMDNAVKNSWGKRFQAAREAMNLSEKDAAARLHLKAHIINIIESERFAEGPPVIFMRGYIRSYGRLLNLPEKDLSQALAQLDFGNPATPTVPSHFRMRESNSNSSSIWSTAFVMLVLTALVGVWWWNSHVRNAPVVDLASIPVETTHVAAATPPATPPAEAITPAQINTALGNPASPAAAAPAPSATTPAIAAAPAAPAPTATTAVMAPKTAEITPQPSAPPAPLETSPQVAEQQSVAPALPASPPEQAAVANNAATATPAPEEATTASSADVATTEDLTDDQPAPVKTHTPKNKLPNLADAEMSVPEEGLDNEASE